MAFIDENTSVIRMKRDFNEFLQDSQMTRGIPAFSLDESLGQQNGNTSNDGTAISVRTLLEKAKEEKVKAAEMIAVKSQVVKLESEVNSLQTSKKRARIEFEQELEAVHHEKEREAQRLKELRSQLKFISDKESAARTELEECRQEMEKQRASYENKLLALQKDKLQLSDDIQKEQEQSWEKATELKHELMRAQTELKISQCELEETRQQLKIQMRRSSDITNQMKENEEYRLKAMQAEQRIKELELQISRAEEDNVVGRAMKTQLITFQEMEKENRRMKDENQYLRDIQENNLLLKEQADSMKQKVARLEEHMEEFTKTKLENEELKSRLQKWEEAETGGPRISSPTQLSKRVSELQSSQAIMLSRQGNLQTSLHSTQRSLQEAEEKVKNLTSQLSAEKSRSQEQADLIKRHQRKLLLVTKERDGYKRIIDSYESEVTINVGSSSLGRIQQLEDGIQGYKNQTDYLEVELNKTNNVLVAAKQQIKQYELQIHELQQQSAASARNQGSSDADQQLVLHLRERLAAVEKSLEKCEADKFALECRIEQRHLQGDYDPTKTKVLHFRMNPASVAQEGRKEEVQTLKEENERLRQRVKLLEEGGGTQLEDITQVVERKLQEPGSSKEIEEMKAQLGSAELKNKRLMEAFKKTSQEFREVCYQLTGYRIDIPTSNQYKLTSMYAESPSDFLLFQQNSSGELQMLGTEFSTTVQDLIDSYLQHQNSVPAFISSVTLELFSRQTVNFG